MIAVLVAHGFTLEQLDRDLSSAQVHLFYRLAGEIERQRAEAHAGAMMPLLMPLITVVMRSP